MAPRKFQDAYSGLGESTKGMRGTGGTFFSDFGRKPGLRQPYGGIAETVEKLSPRGLVESAQKGITQALEPHGGVEGALNLAKGIGQTVAQTPGVSEAVDYVRQGGRGPGLGAVRKKITESEPFQALKSRIPLLGIATKYAQIAMEDPNPEPIPPNETFFQKIGRIGRRIWRKTARGLKQAAKDIITGGLGFMAGGPAGAIAGIELGDKLLPMS